MSIRLRLTLAFSTILVLFAANQSMHLASDRLRSDKMATLDRARQREVLMASLIQRIGDLYHQMSLLGQVELEPGQSPGGHEAVSSEIDKAAVDLRRLASLSEPADRPAVEQLGKTYAELAEAWKRFYDYLGVEPGWAVAFQVKAEPLGQRVLKELPKLQQQQNQRALEAQAQFASLTRQTERVGLGMFIASMLVSIAVALVLARHLTRRLSELNQGVTAVGSMNLEHRISVTSTDELGKVAGAFNTMVESLSTARQALSGAHDELLARNAEIDRQRQASEALLLNILPKQIAAELAERGEVAPRYYEDVTILFTDFVGFTLATETLAAEEVVNVLHNYFKAFDEIAARYGLEKLKTIGDSYFCAGGLPVRTPSHPVDATLAAFEMIREMDRQILANGSRWSIRVGLHTGPVVAGVVGTRKFAFDVWGDTVNLASRMETAAGPNKINISAAVFHRIKDFFAVESRGRILTKEKKELEMYAVLGVLPALAGGDEVPPAAFAKRYRTYFDKELSAFPAFLLGARTEDSKIASTYGSVS